MIHWTDPFTFVLTREDGSTTTHLHAPVHGGTWNVKGSAERGLMSEAEERQLIQTLRTARRLRASAERLRQPKI